MKSIFPLLLIPLVALGGEPAPGGGAVPAGGRLLILDNDRTIEGQIERVGNRYRVRRTIGETWIPAAKVRRLCDSKDEALTFLRARANLNDPDERLRLARWCHLQDLPAQAIEEAREAVRLRSGHGESKRLLAYLEQVAHHATEPPPKIARARKREPVPAIELNAEAMSKFITRVQPILMNACSRCHLTDSAGGFQLERNYAVGRANRRAMQHNLAAVMAQIDFQRPEASPVLVKAVSAHGPGLQAPLSGARIEAFRALEAWVKLVVKNHPHLRKHQAPRSGEMARSPEKSSSVVLEPTIPPAAPTQSTSPPGEPNSTFALPAANRKRPTSPEPEKPPKATSPAAPKPEDEPKSEYDPDIFNRQAHPNGKPPTR
jgi:hypothetical protein